MQIVPSLLRYFEKSSVFPEKEDDVEEELPATGALENFLLQAPSSNVFRGPAMRGTPNLGL